MLRLACPSHAELAAFQLGDLSEDVLEQIADHVERCARCEAEMQGLDGVSDVIVSSLRGLSSAGTPPGGPATPPAVSPTRVGEYEILGELGRGGMGVVYKAWHTKLHRVVALKMLLGGDFARDDDRARFRAEAEAVARLQHPHIIQIFDIGEWRATDASPPVPYFTLEHVDGGSLGARIDGRPQPPEQAARWLLTLARAVHYAHRQGIVHRDLKPSNVLLAADGGLKLCDFGVAKLLTGTTAETLDGLLVGTPEYMAPEQALGQAQRAGPAADVYALGAILYTMLTGRPLFQSASVLDTLEQVRSQEPVSPRRLHPTVPRDLETICLKCLYKDPKRRYATAADLVEDLDRFLGGRTILARPAGAVEQGWKWARRRPTVAALSASTLLLAVVAFALVFWQWRRAEHEAATQAVLRRQAQRAGRAAVAQQAELALNQGLSLCERGEVGHGLLWLARSLGLARDAGGGNLDRAIRINLADWGGRLGRPLLTMRHSAAILDLAFSRDGRTLVSVGKDRNVRTWDVERGVESGPPLVLDHLRAEQWIGRVALSPRDDRTMATVDDEGRAALWDLERRAPAGPPFLHPPGHMIWGVAFSPDGRRLVTCCDDGAARWWDVDALRPIGMPLRHSEAAGYYTAALSPDGRTLVTGGKDRRVVRWDVETGRPLGPASLHQSPVSALAFARDGRRIIAGTRDGRLQVWDPEAGRVSDLPPQGTSITSLAVSPDGHTFATGTAGGVVRSWDVTTLAQSGQTYTFVSGVTGLAFDRDGGVLAMGLDDGTIGLWEIPRPKAIGPALRMETPVQSVAYSPDGHGLLTGSSAGLQWWDADTGRARGPLMHSNRYEPSGAVSSRDGRRTYDVLDMIEAAALGPDGRTLATARWAGAEDDVRGRADLWDPRTGERLRQTPEQPDPLVGVAYSPDAKWLLTWSARPRSALLWDVATLSRGRPLFRSLDEPIRKAAFRPDGKAILLACRDGLARLWGVSTDREVIPRHHFYHGYPVTAVAFDPRNPARIATGCQGGIVRLWDAARGTLLHDMRGNAGEIAAIAFSPDGTMLLTASHDATARFWDVASGRRLGPPLRHTDAVLCLAFDADGQGVLTGTKDGLAQRWRIPAPPEVGSISQVRLWAELRTGLELDEQGSVHARPAESQKQEADPPDPEQGCWTQKGVVKAGRRREAR